jgi:hypothetical protein
MGNAVRLGSRSGLSFFDSDFQKWIGARRRPHVNTTRDFVWLSDVGESWVTFSYFINAADEFPLTYV